MLFVTDAFGDVGVGCVNLGCSSNSTMVVDDLGTWEARAASLAGKRVLVTGGCGYVGEQIALRLLALDPPVALVRILDVSKPGQWPGMLALAASERVEIVQADLASDVISCDGITAILHLASFGMSGREMVAAPSKIRAINLGGTERLLSAAASSGVRAFVYLSTQNVCFGGQPIYNGDELMPYFSVEAHVDEYSRSKALAEMAVLRAHERGGLRTAAIRPASIYGEGERRHLPRIAANIASGMCAVGFGDARAVSEWVHVQSLADAVLSAAGSLLTPELQAAVGGQAFFVSDGTPINMLEFFRPIARVLGVPHCLVRMPVAPVFAAAWLCELLCAWLRPFASLEPLLTRAEVQKVATHHTFSNTKAAALLAYKPRFGSEEGMQRVAAAFAKSKLAEELAAAQLRARSRCATACALLVACCALMYVV